MKQFLKKLNKVSISLIVIGIILLLMLFDFVWSKTYRITVADINPPDPVCSGTGAGEIETVYITLQVTHFGRPVEGHRLIAYSLIDGETAGGFIQNVVRTGEDGCAVFEYTVYVQAPYSEVKPVDFFVMDEDNSVIFEINTELRFQLEIRPREEGVSV